MALGNIDLAASMIASEDLDLLAHEAQRIVDQALTDSLVHMQNTSNLNENTDSSERDRFVELEDDEWKAIQERGSIVKWPTIAEFLNETVGLEKIAEYIEAEWRTSPGGLNPAWLHAIDFLEKKSLEFTDLYIYRVCFSVPTRRQPIPRHTASVYFTLDVSKVKPKSTPIEVSFVFETMRLIHYPDKFRFRQTWLENIILFKEKLTSEIDF